jgi:long-chain acyl-CoA synthetase
MRDPFEYVDDPQKTQAARSGDYFTAGDLGYVDAEGYLYLCDRRSNLVLSGGANIYPAEVEQVLLTHPAVADCVVVGIPDALLGQALKAFIEPVRGVQAGSGLSLDILKFAGQHLAVGKVPRRIEYVSRIPRDPSGKLTASQRQQLVGAG